MGRTSSSDEGCGADRGSPISKGLSKSRFEEIYQKGKRFSGELCRVMALPGTGLIGYSTPRSIGSLARRNRMKRRFRAAVESCGRPGGLDVIVAISASADKAEYVSIQKDLAAGLKRISERWENESESS